MLLGAGALALFVRSRLGVQPDGTRVSLALRGGALTMTSANLKIGLAADLDAAGHKVQPSGVTASNEQMLFLRRERVTLRAQFTAGQPINTARLGYVLFDGKGSEMSHGALQPAVALDPGQTQMLEIVDANLPEAQRIEVRRLP
jgi:hypothetical protein